MDNRWYCPVLKRARKTAQLSEDLTKEIRRLRRDFNRCKHCKLNEDGSGCPTLVLFNSTIQEAIQELNEEWKMT